MTEENIETKPADEQPEPPAQAELPALIAAAKSSRLSPADEDRATALLKEQISGGPKALPEALEAMTSLSWAIGVKAVSEAWPELKPAGRTRLLAGLAKMDSEPARRLRLSLARGLYPADAAAAQKLLLDVCEAMFGAEGGPTARDRQTFANVLLGKAKPWVANVALGELKPAEALQLIEAALEAAQQAPIFTQIWILRWIADAEKFEALPPERVEGLAKAIQRWQPRWRKELRKLVANLPPALEAAMQEPAREAHQPAASAGGSADGAPARESRPPKPAQQPARRGREGRGKPEGGFDLGRTLRDLENYVGRLQSEVQLLQAATRRPEGGSRARGPQQAPLSTGEIDELRRHNEQLEEQNRDLRAQLEELAADHEDRASTLATDDALEQFKALLGLKLKEDYADYAALSRESQTEVIRRHAQEMLGHIFSVLRTEGVPLEPPAA